MINLIPMAGKGSRFVKHGYNLSKPFIPIMGMPMFMSAINSFPLADKYILICMEEFVKKYSFKKIAEEKLPQCQIITVDKVTQGQACTCLLAENYMDVDDSVIISSCDYQLIYDVEKYNNLLQDLSIDVIIWTFKTGSVTKKDPNAFAYCRTEGNNVIEIVEKQTISNTPHLDPAVTGTFTYKKVSDFLYGAKTMINNNIRINNEFYVGTSINQLINQGKKVVSFPIDKFISFGDPFELDLYYSWEEFFYNEENHPYNFLKAKLISE